MSEAPPEHSPVAEAAAEAAEQELQAQAEQEAIVTTAVVAEAALGEAEAAQGQAEQATGVAVEAGETAAESAGIAMAAGEMAEAAGEEAFSAREEIRALHARMEDGFAGIHSRFDSQFPPKPAEPEVTEIHVGNSSGTPGNGTTEAKPSGASGQSGSSRRTPARKRGHRFGSRS